MLTLDFEVTSSQHDAIGKAAVECCCCRRGGGEKSYCFVFAFQQSAKPASEDDWSATAKKMLLVFASQIKLPIRCLALSIFTLCSFYQSFKCLCVAVLLTK